MALVYSFKERAAVLRVISSILRDMEGLNRSIESYRDKMYDPAVEEGYANLSTDVTAMLDDIATMGTKARSLLADFDSASDQGLTYEEQVKPYVNSAFTSWAIDVADAGASNKGKITASGGAPFTNYMVGDTIRLSNFEDPDTDGDYVVDTVNSTTVLHVTTSFGGTDNATDTTGVVRITKR